MVDRFIKNNQTQICCQIWQKNKSKTTLTFLHGAGGSISSWSLILPYLKKLNCNLLFVDLRGHGHSSRPTNWSAYQINHHVEDVLTVLKQNKIKKTISSCICFITFKYL